MTENAEVVSKSEFAKICGVVPGRVTQWIAEGKITGAAIVGEGRSAKIRADIAKRQIGLRRDAGQALGNGLATRLASNKPPAPAPKETPTDDPEDEPWDGTTDDLDRKLKLSKLESAERANRIAAIEEAEKNGLYTETATVRAEMGKIAAQVVRIFEGALPEMATSIAAEFKLQARDVTHHLNELFRKVREQAAEAAAKAVKDLPETLEA